MSGGVSSAFPVGGRRLVIYALHDERGGVEDFVLHALGALRPHAAHILVVAAGSLTRTARESLASVVDDVTQSRESERGLWAHRAALRHLGSTVHDFDEVVLTGDGWFGPVQGLTAMLDAMGPRPLDLWGVTDRRDPRPGRNAEDEGAQVSISPYWIAARERMVASAEWERFWRSVPARRPEGWAAHRIELGLTAYFQSRGFRVGVAYSHRDYPSDQPELFNVELLLADGCPIVSRSIFDQYPLFLDQYAVIGRRVARLMGVAGYPLELLWRNLARTVAPKTLHTNAAMLEVLPDAPRHAPDPSRRILVVAHLPRLDGAAELLCRVRAIPGKLDVVITVPSESDREPARALWSESGSGGDIASFDVRVAEGRRGPDTAVVFEECRDLIDERRHDLIVAVHSGTPPRGVRNAGRYFRRQQHESLLNSPGYVANVFDLFDREPGLGIVFPPTPHIGMSTLGAGWEGLKPRAESVAAQLRIEVPFDWASPHAPIGGMWIARPEAVRPMASLSWPASDTDLIRVHSFLLAYVAGENGFHTRTVATAEHASLSHGSLEYTLDHMSMTMYGYPAGYISLLHRSGPVGSGRARDFARMYLGYRRPRVLRLAGRVTRVVRGAKAILRRATGNPASREGGTR